MLLCSPPKLLVASHQTQQLFYFLFCFDLICFLFLKLTLFTSLQPADLARLAASKALGATYLSLSGTVIKTCVIMPGFFFPVWVREIELCSLQRQALNQLSFLLFTSSKIHTASNSQLELDRRPSGAAMLTGASVACSSLRV